MRLLIVEDSDEMADALIPGLLRRGISAERAATAGDAVLMLSLTNYAAIILDLGLPDEDGIDLLGRLRAARTTIPILILTARGDVRARIAGLNAGADDYLVKPTDFDELQARIEAVLRRRDSYTGRALTLGRLALDLATREVMSDGSSIVLSSRETELLELLMRRAERVVPKRVAEDQLFGLTDELGSNAIEVYVHRLRRKLEQAGADVRIETVRGVGYLLRAV